MRTLTAIVIVSSFFGFLYAGARSAESLTTAAPTDTCRLVWVSSSAVACEGSCNDASQNWGCGLLTTLTGTSKKFQCRCEVWTPGIPPILDDWYWPDSECAESGAILDQNGNWTIICSDLNCSTQCDANYTFSGALCNCP